MSKISTKVLTKLFLLSVILMPLLLSGCPNPDGSSKQMQTPPKLSAAEQHYNEGSSYIKSEQYQKAYDSFSKAISLKQNYIEAYRERGVASFGMGKDAQAATDFDKFFALSGDNAAKYMDKFLYYFIATAYFNTNQKEKAAVLYRKYISLATAPEDQRMVQDAWNKLNQL